MSEFDEIHIEDLSFKLQLSRDDISKTQDLIDEIFILAKLIDYEIIKEDIGKVKPDGEWVTRFSFARQNRIRLMLWVRIKPNKEMRKVTVIVGDDTTSAKEPEEVEGFLISLKDRLIKLN